LRVRRLAAIDLDDDHSLQANEVSDVGTNGNLSAELMTIELTHTQIAPKLALGVCHVSA